jgi:hypothetical protein
MRSRPSSLFGDAPGCQDGAMSARPPASRSPKSSDISTITELGPSLKLADNKHLCVHAGFCHRAGGIWNLVKFSDPQSR